jgi:hypothetical protein
MRSTSSPATDRDLFTTHSVAGWTVGAAGLIALTMGVVGLVAPESQRRALGLADPAAGGEHLTAVLASTSAASVNNGLLYVLAVAKGWSWFPGYTVVARVLMGTGLAVRVATGRAPRSFAAAAVWEGLGAALTAGAIWWDRSRAAR